MIVAAPRHYSAGGPSLTDGNWRSFGDQRHRDGNHRDRGASVPGAAKKPPVRPMSTPTITGHEPVDCSKSQSGLTTAQLSVPGGQAAGHGGMTFPCLKTSTATGAGQIRGHAPSDPLHPQLSRLRRRPGCMLRPQPVCHSNSVALRARRWSGSLRSPSSESIGRAAAASSPTMPRAQRA